MRRPLLSTLMVVVTVAGFASAAVAHPGHGSGFTAGLAHPLTGLDHLLAMVAVGLWASQFHRAALVLLPIVFVSMMAAGAAFGVHGIAMPGAEAGIRLSVIVLGLAVASQLPVPLGMSATLVGLFAVFHGYAHGVEIPAASSPLLHALGFIAGTLALHGIGIGIGAATRRSLLMRTAGGAIAAVGLLLFVV
jgi:urease accessory protein